jgi:lysophospholipase L1-like esterase
MVRKRIFSASLSFIFLANGFAFCQNNITEFSPYWKHKVNQFRILPNPKGEICFLGDSITDGGNWTELTGDMRVTNRGISSDTAWGIMKRLDEVTSGKPAKIFLMIGTNDLSRSKTYPEVRDKIGEILDTIHKDSPKTEIYLESVLPVIDGRNGPYQNKNINPLDVELEKLAETKKATWVNLAPSFKDDSGQLKSEFTEDGLHLNGKGYQLWYSKIKQYLK